MSYPLDRLYQEVAYIAYHFHSPLDEILVMEDGQVVEQGSHAALMDQAGRYARLFSIQAEGYR